MKNSKEMIIVTPKEILFHEEGTEFQGIVQNKEMVEKLLKALTFGQGMMARDEAEQNSNFKQPVPFLVMKFGDQVFVKDKLNNSREIEDSKPISIGFGGCMNYTEELDWRTSFDDLLENNLIRSIKKELHIDIKKLDLKIIGLINDDSDEVRKHQIGLIAMIELSKEQEVLLKKTSQVKGKFVTVSTLKEKCFFDQLENWSKITLNIL